MKFNFGPPQQLKLKQIRRSTPKSGWTMDSKVVDGIKTTMEEFGQYAPIIVSKIGDDEYLLGDGHHRFEAAEKSGEEEIWAYVLDCDAAEAEFLGLTSNFHRRRLSDQEFESALKSVEAHEAQRRAGQGGAAPPVTKRHLAEMLGTNTTDVKRTRALEKLSKGCRAAFDAGEINKGAAYQLTKVEADVQDRLLPQARLVKQKKLAQHEFRNVVMEARKAGPSAATVGTHLKSKPKAAGSKVQELPAARWLRIIHTGKEMSEDELAALSREDAEALYGVACELLTNATQMKERLEHLGVGASEPLQVVSGVKP